RPPGTLLDARLPLLDANSDNGEPVGIVDDLDLDGIDSGTDISAGAPALKVVSVLTGQVLPTRMLPSPRHLPGPVARCRPRRTHLRHLAARHSPATVRCCA